MNKVERRARNQKKTGSFQNRENIVGVSQTEQSNKEWINSKTGLHTDNIHQSGCIRPLDGSKDVVCPGEDIALPDDVELRFPTLHQEKVIVRSSEPHEVRSITPLLDKIKLITDSDSNH